MQTHFFFFNYFYFIIFRDIEKHAKINEFKGHFGDITCLYLSKDDKFIYSGSKDTKPKCWSIETGQVLKTFRGHTRTVNCFSFVCNNFGQEYLLFTAGSDKSIRSWTINYHNLEKLEQEQMNEKQSSCLIS